MLLLNMIITNTATAATTTTNNNNISTVLLYIHIHCLVLFRGSCMLHGAL